MSRRTLLVLIAIAVALLAYLRDPPWLAGVESGLGRWKQAPDGSRYRTSSGHASFFVPATAAEIAIPLRAPAATDQWPYVVAISVDDRVADRLTLKEPSWHESRFRLPPPESRRVRRIDIRVNRTRSGNRGVDVGELEIAGGG